MGVNRVSRNRSRPTQPPPFGVLLVCATALGAAPFATAGCVPPELGPPETVSLRMRGSPASASVVIDDQRVGPLDYVAAHGVALPPGVHHITVQAPGFFPVDREIRAVADSGGQRHAAIEIAVTLVPIPD